MSIGARAHPSDDSKELHGVRPRATDPVAAGRLWQLSEGLTGVAIDRGKPSMRQTVFGCPPRRSLDTSRLTCEALFCYQAQCFAELIRCKLDSGPRRRRGGEGVQHHEIVKRCQGAQSGDL